MTLAPATRATAPSTATTTTAAAAGPVRTPRTATTTPGRSHGGATAQPCGTHAAYVRHRKNGETPCRPCRDAEAAYKRARRTAAKENAA